MRIGTWTCGMLIAMVSACASQQHSTTPAAPNPAAQTTTAQRASGDACPMMVDPTTTRITTSDTANGVAITFTTSAEVNALRARVHRMADMHNRMVNMRAGGGTHPGMHGGGMPPGMHGGGGMPSCTQGCPMHGGAMQGPMVPSRATAQDIDGGARLVLEPANPAQLATLRQQARTRTAMMQHGQCPMMAPANQRDQST